MADPTFLLKPTRSPLNAQQPTRHRMGDEIFAHLGPAAAVDALSTSNGPLRNHLAGASAAEYDFAIRVAIASQRIWEWLNELSGWRWPATEDSPAAGFENPNNLSRSRLSFHVNIPSTDGVEHIGSLPAEEVALRERRMGEISSELADLDMEEMKNQVLANHILPLSRPGTPSSISSKATSFTSAYARMDDLSVVVSTIILQTLPNLAKLTRLLGIWNIRLSVLQRIPALLYAMEDAQVALKAGWTAVSKPLRRSVQVDGKGAVVQKPTLKRSDLTVMQTVLVKKVAAPGRMLDAMLDSLEGMEDTLPDGWLNRMESIEHNYSDWVAACERKIRETDWSRSARSHNLLESPSPRDPSHAKQNAASLDAECERGSRSSQLQPPADDDDDDHSSLRSAELPQPHNDCSSKSALFDQESFDSDFTADSSTVAAEDSVLLLHDQSTTRVHDMSGLNRTMSPVGEEDEEDEVDLPQLGSSVRRDSDDSEGFSTLPEDMTHSDISFSDAPEMSASPVMPLRRIRQANFANDESPPSSPPMPALDHEMTTGELLDRLDVTSIPAHPGHVECVFGKTPLQAPFMVEDFDDSLSASEVTDTTFRRDSTTSDRHLRQQISNIIDAIPAKIKLSENPSTVNLNPPDLQLPRLRRKPSKEPFKRSTSSLSSRTATPSFTLSPSRSRPRHTRGQPEVRIYHLSRNTGEPPIKLFIRCVGERGERVMVRVGGGWADLSEYLKEYASHHGRRSAGTDKPARVEVQDVPCVGSNASSVASGSSPLNRPASSAAAAAAAATDKSPMTPLHIRKARRSVGAVNNEFPRPPIRTPALVSSQSADVPSSEDSQHSRPDSRLSWLEEDGSFLGLAGPTGKRVEMSEENKAWVESVKERVRQVSIERKVSQSEGKKHFGQLGRVGGTKRLFRKATEPGVQTKKSS
ncbi:hypothetical protein E4U42_004825 [Claviceps africana]|uniref:GAR domain-containing protein n=1 Tax=Claviceps africana TaxID=83212 RepID=A0A8K0NHW7_9HYPO|nr:hypothetical protein E4U42_004825 [Claviceps africana]